MSKMSEAHLEFTEELEMIQFAARELLSDKVNKNTKILLLKGLAAASIKLRNDYIDLV